MALLGNGGILELSREIPNAVALSNTRLSGNVITLNNQSFWTGDRVIVAAANPSTSAVTQVDGYMSRDVLDRIKLWTTEDAAHAESGTQVSLFPFTPDNFFIAYYSDDADYVTAIDTAAVALQPLSLVEPEVLLATAIDLPADFDVVCEEANREWQLQADLQEWGLTIDAAALDITAIGETFGENIKALVKGAGNLQFLVEHRNVDGEQDSLALLRLVLLTVNQCNTKARFYLYKDRSVASPRLSGSLYYECDIVLTNTRLNTRATDIISGTADFVTTSKAKLRIAPQ